MTTKRRRDTKPWWESKINLINLLSVLAVVLESTPLLDVVPDGHEKYLALAVFVVNIVLRTFFTDTATGIGIKAGTAHRPTTDDLPPRLAKQAHLLMDEGHVATELTVVPKAEFAALARRREARG